MTIAYRIHPSIGIARVGNSDEFYLAPETIGGLPTQCDASGNALGAPAAARPVEHFKDGHGRIIRQAARFKLFRYDDTVANDPGTEVTLGDASIKSIEWTVHVANKKAIWYTFAELQGDLMLGTWSADHTTNSNSYTNPDNPVGLRNDSASGAQRKAMIIDPGPRSVSGPSQHAEFSQATIPPQYRFGSFPPKPAQGAPITTLGQMLTDRQGRLLVLGGYGIASGQGSITSFAGADGWHDDISDGPVTCRLTDADNVTHELDAWVVVGSPKFAPELENIVALDDIIYDVAVRYQNAVPAMYSADTWHTDYVANYARDIEPIIRRPMDCVWVANVPSMIAFAAPPFDTRDHSAANAANRQAYFAYFRQPEWTAHSQQNQLMSGPNTQGIPLMPLNSGSNSVWNILVDKFLTLTQTQYFLLGQWAAGKFVVDAAPSSAIAGVHALDRASVGNCVGSPMCPGIEVTWSTRNAPIYKLPYRIWQRYPEQHYAEFGLSMQEYDETNPYNAVGGCEPGDMTKRMAIPWQADFFQCTAQFVNFTLPNVNKDANHIPIPPTYYAYWWPPQSPMYVMSGEMTLEGQAVAGTPAGFQVYYARGINSFTQMITAWSYLGFILNEHAGHGRSSYPSFVERERNHTRFDLASVTVDRISNFVNPDDVTFWPVWYLKPEVEGRTVLPSALAGVPQSAVRPPHTGRTRDHAP